MYDSIDRMDKIMGGLVAQQKTVSNNLANAHTPGYSRQTYSFADVLGELSNPYETRLSRNMGSTKNATFAQLDGGRPVDIAEEMVEMQKVFLNYTMVSRRASTMFNNIRRATQIGR